MTCLTVNNQHTTGIRGYVTAAGTHGHIASATRYGLRTLTTRRRHEMRSKEFRRTPFTDWIDNIERVCVECGRKFDLMNEDDSSEWHYGHDCEA